MNDDHARFITPAGELPGAPLLRTEFELEPGHGDIVSATLRLSALGVVEALINGSRVSEDLLTPGWSSYQWRLRYAEYDVLASLRRENAIGLALGNGWYRGRLGWSGHSALYGDEIGAYALLVVEYVDGHRQTIVTDDTWRANSGATGRNDLYDGQDIDARRELPGWTLPGFDDSAWSPTRVLPADTSSLVPYIGPPVRRQETVEPVEILTSPSGRILIDFGQNLVGWVRATVAGDPGDTVQLRHAEVLEDGELGTRPLRSAQASDRFTLSGREDVFEPTFTFHGFRYVEVEGWPGGEEALRARGGIVAVVIGSELERIGRFRSSDERLNRLHANAVWGMRGNFVDVPTDCPQRDERMGWTGDIAVFAPTAAFLYDVDDFLRDWLCDLAIEQREHQDKVPLVVPDVLTLMSDTSGWPPLESTAIWGDAAVWVPWALWTAYGDRQVLEDQWVSMTGHTRRVGSLLSPTGLWDTGLQLGDWLDPDAPPDHPEQAKASAHVVATLCAFRTASIMAAAARVLDRADEAEEFERMADRIRNGVRAHYVSEGVIRSDAPTVYALAIVFGILDHDERERAGDRLAQLVCESGHRITTGFAGTPFITDALTSTGHVDDAYGLLMQTENPSWLYAVEMGATTVWERWDSMLPDGAINPGGMTSFNHYALGAVIDWVHRIVGGIAPLEPGYRSILVAPVPGGGLTSASTSLDAPTGRIQVDWSMEGDLFTLTVELPVPGDCGMPRPASARWPAGRLVRPTTLRHEQND